MAIIRILVIIMQSREYWKERSRILEEQLLKPADELLPHINEVYTVALDNIEEAINSFYQRFSVDNEISFQEATLKLNSKERKKFQMTLESYIEKAKENGLDEKWLKRLQNASTLQSADRLTIIKLQMQQQVEILEAYKSKSTINMLSGIYQESYYRSIFEIQRGLGIGTPFATLDIKTINKVLAKPWAPDGISFSKRIWGADRTNLVHQLQTRFTQGIIRGDNPKDIIDSIAKALNSSKKVTSKLVLTEAAAFSAMAREDSYNELGVDEFEFVATLDETTCTSCGALDGQHFPRDKYEIGITAPPLHPWDRCTTVPYFRDEFTQKLERAARNGEGGTYYVPTDMRYDEWKAQYVYGSGAGLQDALKSDKLLESEIAAINDYISAKSYDLNEKLRNGVTLNATEQTMVDNLNSALDKLPEYKGTVYRSVSDFGIKDPQAFINSHIAGQPFQSTQFLSTGTSVYDDSFPIQYVIQSTSGRDMQAFNPSEGEILFKPNTEFWIEKVENNTIYLKEV